VCRERKGYSPPLSKAQPWPWSTPIVTASCNVSKEFADKSSRTNIPGPHLDAVCSIETNGQHQRSRPAALQKRHIRRTELTLIRGRLGRPSVKWLATDGGPASVIATTRSATSGPSGGMRDGRVLIVPKAGCALVPEPPLPAPDHRLGLTGRSHDLGSAAPSAVRRTIFARQTCFRGLLRFSATASNSPRSVALNRMSLRSCIPQTRTPESGREFPSGSKWQVWST
jgi:hypothetical protein